MDAPNWDDVMGRFRDHLTAERSLAPPTVRNYLDDLEPLREFMLERDINAFSDLDRRTVRTYLSWLHELGYVRPSIARKLSVLRTLFRWLNRQGIADQEPLPARGSFKTDSRLPRFLSQDEAAKLMTSPDPTSDKGIRDRALLEIIYAAGLRVSEVNGLDLDRVNLETRELRVTGKGAKERVVLIGQPARDAIRVYVQQVRPNVASADAGGALFVNRFGERLSQRSIQKIVRGLRRAGRPRLSSTHAHAAPFIRDAHAGRRRGPPRSPGAAGTFQPRNHPDLYSHHAAGGAEGVHVGASARGRKSRANTASRRMTAHRHGDR